MIGSLLCAVSPLIPEWSRGQNRKHYSAELNSSERFWDSRAGVFQSVNRAARDEVQRCERFQQQQQKQRESVD